MTRASASERRQPVRCLVILNTAAGSYDSARLELDPLHDELVEAGLRTTVHRVEPKELMSVLDDTLTDEPTLVVAGGGDGTLRSVAGRLVGGPHTLGVLPLGTMNRFATQLGIPEDVVEARQVLTGGSLRPIDLAEANDEPFLNTCVLGVYPELARRREQRRRRHQRWPNLLRWLVDTLGAARLVLRHWRKLRFRLAIDGEPIDGELSALLVTNNAATPLGPRTVDTGGLGLYIPRVTTPLRLFWLAVRAIVLGPKELDPLEVRTTDEAVLTLPENVPVALDAEVTSLCSPLHLRVRPEAVWVRVADDSKASADR